MMTHNLGYPRIGSHRELKKAAEAYWAGKSSSDELRRTARRIRQDHWKTQLEAGIQLIPCNDFSFYDHVLDTMLMVGAIPERYHPLIEQEGLSELELYFAMARGYQRHGYDVTALEMTKWFDTNYHYLVPEFTRDQHFRLFSQKASEEFEEALSQRVPAKPVLLGPVSFLLLGKEKETGFDRLDLLDRLLPVYIDVLARLDNGRPACIQFDEPCLCLDLSDAARAAFEKAYRRIRSAFPHLELMVATYFGDLGDNLATAWNLPVRTLHVDLTRHSGQLDRLLALGNPLKKNLSLGLVDGRNIWKNDPGHSLACVKKVADAWGRDRLWLAPSCSLMHVPVDIELETDDTSLPPAVKERMAFAKQKLSEVALLAELAGDAPSKKALGWLEDRKAAAVAAATQPRSGVKTRTAALGEKDARRGLPFAHRKALQQEILGLPAYPTTTIGSFPQTAEVRHWRAALRKGDLSQKAYEDLIKLEIARVIRWQEEIGLDVLVHGEFERNDMVEYFGEQLEGFFFTRYGWVQSYGSRCVKPPIIAGDVSRKGPMTVEYARYAQSLTGKPVKGMLTGPVTILKWSFVRDDQPLSQTCLEIACAVRDEVQDLEAAGIRVIQIDEPALREGLPLRAAERAAYLVWAVRAFRVASSGVRDETQIHTHMCYAEFNDIIESIADMDADVITIETSRSQMELLEAFGHFSYPNDIGPGVYDIHSPRVPSGEEMMQLVEKAVRVVDPARLWINPDCGLKTRGWPETEAALHAMVGVARALRK